VPAAEFAGEEPRMALWPPFRTAKIPEERGRHEDLTRGLGEVGEVPETVAQRRGRAVAAVLCGGGSVEREGRKRGARGGEEVLMPLYRVEEEGETTR
jgi:hypothetical protein